MTQEQLQHYIKGGKFKATYSPRVIHDLESSNRLLEGLTIKVYQNVMVAPLTTPKEYKGQHAFNANEIYGWFPEEDIQNLEIIDEYIEDVQFIPKFVYKLTYTHREQLHTNFGIGSWKVPLVVSREFSSNQDDYVKSLSKPQATKIERAIWYGEPLSDMVWERIV